MNQTAIVAVIVAVVGSTGIWNLVQSLITAKANKTEEILEELKEMREDVNLLKRGEQELLKDRLNQAYNYHKQKGYCPAHEKEIFESNYRIYHSLGKNGVMDMHYKKLMAMPEQK